MNRCLSSYEKHPISYFYISIKQLEIDVEGLVVSSKLIKEEHERRKSIHRNSISENLNQTFRNNVLQNSILKKIDTSFQMNLDKRPSKADRE